jgi:hypothetical protein
MGDKELSIKFSHAYLKMPHSPEGFKLEKSRLIGVLKVNKSDLQQEFIDYDTSYLVDGSNKLAKYELPGGELIILFLIPHYEIPGFEIEHLDKLWTTIRRYTPQKFKYYTDSIGKVFNVVIDD